MFQLDVEDEAKANTHGKGNEAIAPCVMGGGQGRASPPPETNESAGEGRGGGSRETGSLLKLPVLWCYPRAAGLSLGKGDKREIGRELEVCNQLDVRGTRNRKRRLRSREKDRAPACVWRSSARRAAWERVGLAAGLRWMWVGLRGLMRVAHCRLQAWVCPGWPGAGWPGRCWTLLGLLGVARFGRRGGRAPGCDEKMEQMRALEVRRAQLDGFANSSQQQRAPSRPLHSPRKSKVRLQECAAAGPATPTSSQAALGNWGRRRGIGK